MNETNLPDLNDVDKEKLHREYLRDLRANPNNLSFWFPKVKDCGLRVPKTVIVTVPDELVTAFALEQEGDAEKIRTFIRESIIPALKEIPGLPFIKNGCFSDKFVFKYCCPDTADEETLFRSVSNIQMDSLMYDTGGNGEIVLRERIPSPENRPRIYHGMPMNTEFRLFYDFDSKTPLYLANYWDPSYCKEPISERSEADAKAYADYEPELMKNFGRLAERVFYTASAALRSVEGLTGIWSVDILAGADDELWLIDMALGRQSAYWDPEKAILCRVGEMTCRYISESEYSQESPRDRAVRRVDFKAYQIFGLRYYLNGLQSVITHIYMCERIGKEIPVKDADIFGAWDFIERELPDNGINALLKDDASYAEKKMNDDGLDSETRKLFSRKWERLTDVLFAKALEAMLEKKYR